MSSRGKHWILISATIVAALAMSSCASITSGSHQDMRFNTTPQGATVMVYDENESVVWSGETPVTARMSRGDGFFRGANYRVELTLEGYEPVSIYVTPELNAGWYIAGNFFLGGFIGWLIVDPATGAMWNLRPDTVNRQLSESTAMDSETGLVIVMKESVPAGLRSSMEYIGTMAPGKVEEQS